MMRLGAEAIFVGSGIFKSEHPKKRASAIVQATTHFQDPNILAKVSEALGAPLLGTPTDHLSEKEILANRGY
ncbi:hypothetical protein ACRRVA_01860 [Candidatus Cardinium hertigii]